MMKDGDFNLFRGFALGQTDERTDICDCRLKSKTFIYDIFRENSLLFI